MITEEEAKTKWCPFVRYAYPNGATGNRDEHDHPAVRKMTRCQGSACMAWRWEAGASVSEGVNGTHKGYCGLAGKP